MSWLFSRALVEAFSADICLDGELSALSSGTPTPQAYLSQGRTTAAWKPSRFGTTFRPLTDDRNSRPLSEFVGGLLNPTWVEWLMGWPVAWTDCAPLGTAKYHEWQRQHSPNSPSNSTEEQP